MYKSHMFLKEQAKPESASPETKSAVDDKAANLMCFSARGPNIAAPMPRKKMFKQNVNPIWVVEHPSNNVKRCGVNKLKE